MHTNFTPGPSQLYFTVADHLKRALKDGIPSLSHRTQAFEKIYHSATTGLRQLLSIPENFEILFTSSATETWERIIQNLVEEKSFHLVNGAFSEKFFEIASQLQRKSGKYQAKEGDGFPSLEIDPSYELLALTHNETSTGVSLPIGYINEFRKRFNGLIAVDAVSSLPYPAFDYTALDCVYFSVQKAFGLPAGLGVWIINERCIDKANRLVRKNIPIGSYHSIPSLLSYAKKNQTPETPNVLGIYLLSQIVDDFLRRGIDQIRRETEYKAALLYHALEQHPVLKPFVTQKIHQSKTVIVTDCGVNTQNVIRHLEQAGILPGDGYGKQKATQLRFANFPTHSREQYELLVDTLNRFNT